MRNHYKSFNGTSQTARNFREGTLNIGQMGFDNTTEERITKEMITDHHKNEQDRIEERLSGRTRTTLYDTIDLETVTPGVINWTSTGRPATTGDLMQADSDLVPTVNEITMYNELLRTTPAKINKLTDKKNTLLTTGPEWWRVQDEINDLNRDMTQERREILRLEGNIPVSNAEYEQIQENIKPNEQEIILFVAPDVRPSGGVELTSDV